MGFGEEEEADLGDVGAGGDVDEVVFFFGVEGVAAGKVVECGVDLLEVPGVLEVDEVGADDGFGGDGGDVGGDLLGEFGELAGVDQFEALDGEVFVLNRGRRWVASVASVGVRRRHRGWRR